jgi:hypothetical protein
MSTPTPLSASALVRECLRSDAIATTSAAWTIVRIWVLVPALLSIGLLFAIYAGPDHGALAVAVVGAVLVSLAYLYFLYIRTIALLRRRQVFESVRSNQPLHPTPTAAEAPASGAGERRR